VARAAEKAVAIKRGRGRPARLSRESILEAGLALLDRSPEESLTLSRVAEEVEAVPAALYRHVGSHDELLDGVLALALEGIPFEIRRRAAWPAQVRDWMTCLRAHLLQYPAVVSLIGRRGRTSPAWFDATAVLVEILERAGLRGASLARATLWLTETTMGILVMQASIPFSEQIDEVRRALPEMSKDARRCHAPLMEHLSSISEDAFFELVVDRTIAALTDLVAKRQR
jgi:TetR/AcrR family transcriptional regulator, tetracycline repressor protein